MYDRRRNVVELILDTRAVSKALEKGDPSSLTPTQLFIYEQPDARMCMRELGPSRRIMMATLNLSFMRSRTGFFNALLFRNIMFNTQAYLRRPKALMIPTFANLVEWNKYVASLRAEFPGEAEDFFCNRGALGQPIHDRVIEHAQHFWEVASVCDWPEEQEWPLSFEDMHALLWRIKNKHGLPGCGKLSIYLLCADMVSYGLVELPTWEFMARTIGDVDLGAMSGLRLLGYLKDDDPVESPELVQAIDDFHQDVGFLLTSRGLNEFLVNAIDVEHILCKFSRLWKLNYYRTPPPV